ncbi:hypothetical protein, partial [Shewanella sp. Isolate11]|uniref:hypothetical protein n=1 Tax=Shewanella sp. Isolate11 TaxID=2908530 RepID=UPI001EFCCE07
PNRVYVLEYEQFNDNAWNYGEAPIWRENIKPRLTFYETIELGLDSDFDGIIDSEDDDMDNDGTINPEDTYPLDPTEQADSDGDGLGDNADAFPDDPSEQVDSDGDGSGDNSDLAPNDPLIGAARSFTSADLKANYLYLLPSRVVEPTFRLGVTEGDQYLFDNEQFVGQQITRVGPIDFSFSFDTDVLEMFI